MSRTEDLLEDILEELRTIRTGIIEIQEVMPIARPLYDADDHQKALEKVADALEEVGDRMTGGIGGIGGADLEDILSKLAMIEINTTPD